jgi:hypothetical protein
MQTKRNKKQKHSKKTRKIKPMNCNPITKGKTSVGISCLTDDVLYELKDSFNKSHRKKTIKSKKPKQIWKDLKNKLKTCDKEDCWLDSITDTQVRNKLDKNSFAPDRPTAWAKNPDKWLSNFDIAAVLKQYEKSHKNFRVIGPTPIDFDTRPVEQDGTCVWEELCTFNLKSFLDKGKTKIGIVFNLDNHKQNGSHWVSLFLDLEDQFIFYMDSNGESIPDEIKVLVTRITEQGLKLATPMHIHFYENCPMEHQYENNECGMYSLYFIITMLTNKTEKTIFKNYTEKIDFFKNKRIPDKYMHRYRKKYFNS